MFYEVFQRLCSMNGKAETTVCRDLGMSPANAKVWRNGKDPLPSTKKKIADYFGVDPSYFDKPFEEAPLQIPDAIPVQVITIEELKMLSAMKKLTDDEREFVMRIVETLVQK